MSSLFSSVADGGRHIFRFPSSDHSDPNIKAPAHCDKMDAHSVFWVLGRLLLSGTVIITMACWESPDGWGFPMISHGRKSHQNPSIGASGMATQPWQWWHQRVSDVKPCSSNLSSPNLRSKAGFIWIDRIYPSSPWIVTVHDSHPATGVVMRQEHSSQYNYPLVNYLT